MVRAVNAKMSEANSSRETLNILVLPKFGPSVNILTACLAGMRFKITSAGHHRVELPDN